MTQHAESVAVVQIIRYRASCPECGYQSGEYSTPDFARLAIKNHTEATHSDGEA